MFVNAVTIFACSRSGHFLTRRSGGLTWSRSITKGVRGIRLLNYSRMPCSRRRILAPRVAAGWRKRLLARTQKRPHRRPLGHYFDRPRQTSHRLYPRLRQDEGGLLPLLLRQRKQNSA